MNRNKTIKRLIAGTLVFVVGLFGFAYMQENANAADSVVKYQEVDYDTFKDKIGSHSAPDCTLDTVNGTNIGYLFAGWYKTASNDEPITSADGITSSVYAKFIPSYLVRVACQVDINADSAKRNLRVVSLVDSDNYKAVGFNVYGRYDADDNGTNETEWTMYEYTGDEENPNVAESKDIYSGLYVYSEDGATRTEKYPTNIFGTEADGFCFTTVSIAGIPESFHEATMAVQPYWITPDGTYVEGMAEFNRVQDYTDNIVNISVNLKDATEIMAGMLNITMPNGFTYSDVEFEGGRVFEEMSFKQVGNVIKCIGNMANVANASEPNEVYVNLRFTKEDKESVTPGTTEFIVRIPNKGFCNVNETVVTDVNAWNIKY